MSVRIAFRSYLSISHLSAATLFAKQCSQLEAQVVGVDIDSGLRRQHNAYAVSSVILSAAFLEATINELFCDCADGHNTAGVSRLPAWELMGSKWREGALRTASYSMLNKYDEALTLNEKPKFSLGSRPGQDVKLLVELRNALIHYEAETIEGPTNRKAGEAHKFEKKLAGKFPTNALTCIGNPFYPDKVLGAGCANWAVRSAVSFTDQFFEKLGMQPTYAHVKSVFLD